MDDATLRGMAEAFLTADARVAGFEIGEAEGKLEIALTPAPAWVAAERAAGAHRARDAHPQAMADGLRSQLPMGSRASAAEFRRLDLGVHRRADLRRAHARSGSTMPWR